MLFRSAADSGLCINSHHEIVKRISEIRRSLEALCKPIPIQNCSVSGGKGCFEDTAKIYSEFSQRGKEFQNHTSEFERRMRELKIQNEKAIVDHERAKGRIDQNLKKTVEDSVVERIDSTELRRRGLAMQNN